MKHYENHPHIAFIGADIFAAIKEGDYYIKPASDATNRTLPFKIKKVTQNEIVYVNLADEGYAGSILREKLARIPYRGLILRETGKGGLLALVDSEMDVPFKGEKIPKKKH